MRRFKKAAISLALALVVILQVSVPALADTVTVQGHIDISDTPTPTPTTFTVTYDPNGGAGGMSETVSDSTYTLLNDASAGVSNATYYFSGWNTESSGDGTDYKAGDIVALIGDLTLYAQWTTKEELRITYDSNGGTGSLIFIVEVIGGSYDHTVLSADGARKTDNTIASLVGTQRRTVAAYHISPGK